jgi:hypothetical protein
MIAATRFGITVSGPVEFSEHIRKIIINIQFPFSALSHDRSKISSKASSPLGAI